EPIALTIDNYVVLGRRLQPVPNQPSRVIDFDSLGAFDKGVSRTHARIIRQNNKFLIEDLGSSNGTFVNGHSLRPQQPVPLKNGDEIRLGELRMGIYVLGASNADNVQEHGSNHAGSASQPSHV